MDESYEVYDEEGNLLEEYDLELGYIKSSVRVVHHDAIESVEEEGHWETIAEYPNGGKDVEWVVDVQGVQAIDAWDEEIPIYVYVLYTNEELAAIEAEKNKPTLEDQFAEQKATIEDQQTQIEKQQNQITEQNTTIEDQQIQIKNQQRQIDMLMECLLEMSEAVYA